MFKKLMIMSALLLAAACTSPCNPCRCTHEAGAKCICSEKGQCTCPETASDGACKHCNEAAK